MNITRVLRSIICLAAVATSCNAQTAGQAQSPVPTMQQANTLLQQGNAAQASSMFEAIHTANPKNGQAWFMHGYALHMQGKLDEALPIHIKAASFPKFRPVALYNIGCVHAIQNRPDEAFDSLRLAADMGQATVAQLTGDSDLESLHDDERWSDLIDRLKAAKTNSPAAAMHFWVGEWDCYSPNGTLSGTNNLELVNNDMFIHEQWTNSQGQDGQSFNYYDIEVGEWRQIWVDQGRQLEMTADPTTPGRLMFEGYNYDQAGSKTPRQMLVLDLGDGRVLQEGRGSPDGGKTWNVIWRLIYMPKGEAFNGDGLPAPGS